MNRLEPEVIHKAVLAEHANTDMELATFMLLGAHFVEAHQRVGKPGLSLEIGTRGGGSAALFLRLLDKLYDDPRPMLFTVDPYGCKPYGAEQVPAYGNFHYLQMKERLKGWPNHAHFYMNSSVFISNLFKESYWYAAEEHQIHEVSFAFLDGDHTKDNLLLELAGLEAFLAPKALVVVDNAAEIDGSEHVSRRWNVYRRVPSPNPQNLALVLERKL